MRLHECFVVNKKFATLLLGVIGSGLIYVHPAYAHNFGGDQSASWLAKVAEIKTEVANVVKHVGQKNTIDYYVDVLSEYWTTNDTREMGERNALLQQEIPATINATLTDANVGNQSMVNDDVAKLNGYLDESVPVRIDKDKLNNSTVQALAVTFVIKEALEKYGDAVNSTVDLNDMSQITMPSHDMSEGKMSNMTSSTIIKTDEYENSVSLATAAQQMFSDIASKNPSVSGNSKLSDGFAKLVRDLNNKADVNTIMVDVHVGIHPTLIEAYNIQGSDAHGESVVPEFPMPTLLSIIAIAGAVMATRFKSCLGF